MTESLASNFITYEMLTHPALFAHPQAQKIAIIDNHEEGILLEVLKHTQLTEIWHVQNDSLFTASVTDPRLKIHTANTLHWLGSLPPNSFDLFIIPTAITTAVETYFQHCWSALQNNGMLIQQCESPFQLSTLAKLWGRLQSIGFSDLQLINYPEPQGWRTAVMAIKQGNLKRISEKTIFNKKFNTQYYNYDMHKAALAMPEFIRNNLTLKE